MIAKNQDEKNDLAIYWPRDLQQLEQIRRTGRCPSANFPHKLPEPGGTVALVDSDGSVMLLFRVNHIERDVAVTAADGKKVGKGCVIVAQKRSLRPPGRGDPPVLTPNLHALGAFAYFDSETYCRVIYDPDSEPAGGGDATQSGRHPGTNKVDRLLKPKKETKRAWPPCSYPFLADNTGKTLAQPEKKLVLAYVTWIGDIRIFVKHPLKGTELKLTYSSCDDGRSLRRNPTSSEKRCARLSGSSSIISVTTSVAQV